MEENKIIEKDGKKYIDAEEVLYEYDCYTNWIFIRHLFFIFGLYATYSEGYIAQEKHLGASIVFILLLIVMLFWLITDIKTLINRGIYITANNLITFSGKKISLDNIYYRWDGGGAERGSVSFRLYNKSNLIISCLVKDDEYYNQMIDILQNVSKNKNLKEYSPRDGKRKLITEATVD